MGATAPSGPVVIKIGGRALETEGAARELGHELAAASGRAVVVHGGGADVSEWSRRLGLRPAFVDGLRVTDEPTLEVAVAVLAGLANKRLVVTLRAAGVDAVGLAALDGGTVAAAAHPLTQRLGRVGRVAGVQPALLLELLERGRVPVLASIGADRGRLLNLNADDVAAALAGALAARALVLLSDAPGVRLGGSIAPRLDGTQARRALESGEVTDGMRPKLEAARAALAAGVPVVHVASWQGPDTLAAVLEERGTGTVLVGAEASDG